MNIDFARAALQAARAAARGRPTAVPARRTPVRQSRRSVVRDGREPVGLGTVVTGLVAERSWEMPAAGGSLLDQWAAIVPELVDKVFATHFDAASGRIDLQPVSPAYGTQLRLLGPQLIQRINVKLGTQTVRSIRVLAPRAHGPARSTLPAPAASPAAGQVSAQVRTRETASAGYRQALAALQTARPTERVAQAVTAAVERQDQALRSRREPESAFADAIACRENQAAARVRAAAAATSQALAIHRARAERSGAAPLREVLATPGLDRAGAA